MADGNLRLVKLCGGLGNQLFQYAFGCHVARNYNCEVAFFEEPGLYTATPAISHFVKDIRYASAEELRAAGIHFTSRLHYRITRKLASLMPSLKRHVLIEPSLAYQAELPNRYLVFDGYWQSPKYFEAMTDPLRKSILMPQEVLTSPYLKEISVQQNAVFVHIRRGDYISNPRNHSLFHICDISYYEQAMRRLTQRLGALVFYVFSNDIPWVKEHLDTGTLKCVFVEHTGQHADWKDFACMAACRHAIISNSTFSWWAAWLIPSAVKQVVAPKDWYIPAPLNATTRDLIPQEWTRI